MNFNPELNKEELQKVAIVTLVFSILVAAAFFGGMLFNNKRADFCFEKYEECRILYNENCADKPWQPTIGGIEYGNLSYSD